MEAPGGERGQVGGVLQAQRDQTKWRLRLGAIALGIVHMLVYSAIGA